MSYYSVIEVTPTSEDWIGPYSESAGRIVAAHGGKYLANSPNHQFLEGEGDDVVVRVIIEWPSKESAIAFMNDPEYIPLLKARTEGSISSHVLIEGRDD